MSDIEQRVIALEKEVAALEEEAQDNREFRTKYETGRKVVLWVFVAIGGTILFVLNAGSRILEILGHK